MKSRRQSSMRAHLLVAFVLLTVPVAAQESGKGPASRPAAAESRPSQGDARAAETTRQQLQLIQDVARLSKPEPKPDPKAKDSLKRFSKWSEREKARQKRLAELIQTIFERNSETEVAVGQRRRVICHVVHGFTAFAHATAYARLLEAGDEDGSQKHATKHAVPRGAAKEFVVIEVYDIGVAKVRFLDETGAVFAHVVELAGWGAVVE
jgi:hypothetical protein